MYDTLKGILSAGSIQPERVYNVGRILVNIYIGSSKTNTKCIDLFTNIPPATTVRLMGNSTDFELRFEGRYLVVRKIDKKGGWKENRVAQMLVLGAESVYCLQEKEGKTWVDSYIAWRGKKIFDSRDNRYHIVKSQPDCNFMMGAKTKKWV